MIHDISDVQEQFKALDLRGQIVRNRKDVLEELLKSLRTDFEAGRFRAVILHYRVFLHHAVNAVLVRTIPDSRILVGQQTASGNDMVKVQQALTDELVPTDVTRQLCDGLSKTMHGINPPPEDAEGLAGELMKAADMWVEVVTNEDRRLNKWFDDLVASGITPSRVQPAIKKRKRNGARVI